MTGLVILVPMLGRPHHVAPLLESIRATCDARVVFLLSPGDDEVYEVLADEERVVVDWPNGPGDYTRKINHGIAVTAEDHIFTGASDLLFHPGWYEAAAEKLNDQVGVVGTNDLGNVGTANGGHATHFLVARWYVERFGTADEPGKFYHEGYWHELCDNEAYETAKARRRYAHARDSHVEHLHPLWGKAEWDPTYSLMRQRIDEGRLLFLKRRRLWRLMR